MLLACSVVDASFCRVVVLALVLCCCGFAVVVFCRFAGLMSCCWLGVLLLRCCFGVLPY